MTKAVIVENNSNVTYIVVTYKLLSLLIVIMTLYIALLKTHKEGITSTDLGENNCIYVCSYVIHFKESTLRMFWLARKMFVMAPKLSARLSY